MSCTFWIRRKRLAAEKAKAEAIETAKETEKISATVADNEKSAKKPAKKGGAKKNDN